MAYPAVKNVDFHFVGMEFADFIAKRLKSTAGFEYGIGIDGPCCAHGISVLELELVGVASKTSLQKGANRSYTALSRCVRWNDCLGDIAGTGAIGK